MIEVENLTKRYGKKTALDHVSFKIRNGKIYGLLGPNGAGKSTTMNLITGCLSPSEGTVFINGYDILEHPREAKRQIGYLPEQPPLFADMTPLEYLNFVAEAKGVAGDFIERDVRKALKATDLEDVENRLIRNLSKGFRQRVGIAQAILGNPDIIILDEPTVGLDPRQLTGIRSLIRSLGREHTVIISSHILSEISALCDHVIILSHGRVVADSDMEDLKSEAAADKATCLCMTVKGDEAGVRAVLEITDGVLDIQPDRDAAPVEGAVSLRVTVSPDRDLRDEIFFAMADHQFAVISLEQESDSLEQIYLSLTADAAQPAETEEKEA